MLRPSRPMIRPFISSLGSSTRRVVLSLACLAASRCIATERMLRARRSASRLVSASISCSLQAGLMPGLLLDVGEQQLLGLRGAQPRDPLQLAPLHALGALQLLGLLGEVALAVLERLQAPLQLGVLDLQRLRLTQGALLHPRDLGPARLELIRRRAAEPSRPWGRSSVVGSCRRHGCNSARISIATSPFRAGLVRLSIRTPPSVDGPATGGAGDTHAAMSSTLPRRGLDRGADELACREAALGHQPPRRKRAQASARPGSWLPFRAKPFKFSSCLSKPETAIDSCLQATNGRSMDRRPATAIWQAALRRPGGRPAGSPRRRSRTRSRAASGSRAPGLDRRPRQGPASAREQVARPAHLGLVRVRLHRRLDEGGRHPARQQAPRGSARRPSRGARACPRRSAGRSARRRARPPRSGAPIAASISAGAVAPPLEPGRQLGVGPLLAAQRREGDLEGV